jgi:hypothetical protein
VILLKKTLKFLLALTLAIGIMATTSSEASAAATAAMIGIGQTQTQSSSMYVTKNLTIKVANGSPNNGRINVSLVNTQTGVVTSRNVAFNNNRATNVLTMNSVTPGVYYIVLTCLSGNLCQGSGIMQGT